MWSNGYGDDTDFAVCWFTKTQKSIYLQNETIFLKKLIHYALRAIIHYDKNIFQAEVLFEISKHVVWHLDEHRKILCCSKTKFGQLSKGQPYFTLYLSIYFSLSQVLESQKRNEFSTKNTPILIQHLNPLSLSPL